MNYSLGSVTANNADITPRPITITVNSGQTKVYGASEPGSFSYAGTLINLDNFTGALLRAAGESVGTYAIGQGTLNIDDGLLGANYNITFVGANFTITAAPLTVTANPDSNATRHASISKDTSVS